MRRTLRGMALMLMVVPAAIGTGAGPAHGTDLETLRARAQEVADRVTMLEHRLEGLGGRMKRLEAALGSIDKDLALSHLELRDAEIALERARDVYIDRAIEAYKASSTGRVELFLGASDITGLELAARINERIAAADTDALAALQRAAEAAAGHQESIDDRKQQLLRLRAQVGAVREEVSGTISQRRSTLRLLTSHIDRLESEARAAAAAAAAAAPAAPSSGLGGPAPRVPEDFIGTGVTFEGIASWYGPGFEGNPTASGAIFDPSGFTAASRDLPLGTWLHVVHEGRGVVVLVNDRGPFIDGRVLDLSQGAAEAIGITGLGWIRAEIIIEQGEG